MTATATGGANPRAAAGHGAVRFEDFVPGAVYVTGGRTIDIGDISLFAGLTGDHYPLHTDENYASQTQFGGRIAHGPLTFSVAVGLVALSGLLGDAIVALREVSSIRALKPVRPGDTLRVQVQVVDTAPARRPDQGIVTFDYQVINQHDDTVMTVQMVMLAKRRKEGTP